MSQTKQLSTIYDVADKAGVSIATVSRLLNTPGKVNPKTRDKILDAIDALGFVPKAEARARALNHAGRIGVLTPFFTFPSFVQRLRGIASELSKSDYELAIYSVDSADRLKGYLASLPYTGNLDGLIIVSLNISEVEIKHLLKSNLPIVFIESCAPSLVSVGIDDYEGGKMAARYLVNKGHHRIAFLGDTNVPDYITHKGDSRLNGFRDGLQEFGIELPDELVRISPYSFEQAHHSAIQLLSLPNKPSAIFAATDLQALGVLKTAKQLDISVPSQLAVLGFDDLDIAKYEDLTTICQHLDESGRLSVEILLSRIKDSSRPIQQINIPLVITERKTV